MIKFENQVISLNKNWLFFKNENEKPIEVDVPHNWNSKDGQDGGNDYYRGTCTYIRNIKNDKAFKDKVLVLEFQGVNASADVYFNNELLTHHDGGYSTFRVVIPNSLLKDDNELKVLVDNSVDYKVYPQRADFTFYGGIYRDVNLLVLNENHFDRITDGGLGATIDAYVKDDKGIIDVKPHIEGKGTTIITLFDKDGKEVQSSKENRLEVSNPHLWNGLKDPYLYTLRIELVTNGNIEDES